MNLYNLKPGDECVVENRSGSHIAQVIKVTKTQITVHLPTCTSVFMLRTGRLVGDGPFPSTSLKLLDSQTLKAVEHTAMRRKRADLAYYDTWKGLSDEFVNRVWEMIDEERKKGKEATGS